MKDNFIADELNNLFLKIRVFWLTNKEFIRAILSMEKQMEKVNLSKQTAF